MNKIVNNKGNLFINFRLFNKGLIASQNVNHFSISHLAQMSNIINQSNRQIHFFKTKNTSFNFSPKYSFSMRHNESSAYNDSGLAANLSDSNSHNILSSNYNASQYNTYEKQNSINTNTSSQNNTSKKDEKSLKNQQQQTKENVNRIQFTQGETNKQDINYTRTNLNKISEQKNIENTQQIESLSQKNKFEYRTTQSISVDSDLLKEQTTKDIKIASKQFKFDDFCELTKFRLSVTNTLVALPTYLYLAESVSPSLIPLGIATQLMAMSSQTTNQIIEQEHDKQMIRTQRRPLPSGLISNLSAGILAGTTYLASNAIFLSCFPIQTALVANAIFFGYIGIYTPMKRYTTFNTTVGAIVGALTPYIGYTAAGGSITDLYPLYYSLYMVFWQYQHFYGISWIYKNDYKRAGYKMCEQKREALFYILTSFSINVAANYALFFTNPVYSYLSIGYSALMAATYALSFAYPTYKFYKDPTIQNAKLLKNSSYIHLSVFFLIIIVDMCLRIYENKCKKGLENSDKSQPNKLDEQSLIGKIHKFLFEKKSTLQAGSQSQQTVTKNTTNIPINKPAIEN